MFATLSSILTSTEIAVFGVFMLLSILGFVFRRWQALPLFVIGLALSFSYVAQRLIFLRLGNYWDTLMIVSAVLMAVYAFVECKPRELPPPPKPWVEVTLLLLICVIALVFRTHYYTTFPPGCYYDEAEIGKDYLRNILSPGFSWRTIYEDHLQRGVPITYWYPAGYFSMIFGKTAQSVRLPAVISGMLTIPLFYALLRLQFGWRIALMGTMTMAASIWHVMASRTGFSCIQTPMFTVMGLLFLTLAAKGRKPWSFGWLIAFGLMYFIGFTSYHPTRTVIALPFLFGGHVLVGWLIKVVMEKANIWAKVGIAAVLAVMIGVGSFFAVGLVQGIGGYTKEDFREPIMTSFAVQGLVMDLMERRFFFTQVRDGNYWQAWKRHFNEYIRMFHFKGDRNHRHNVPSRPAFNFFTGIFLVPGLVYALFRFRNPHYFMYLCVLGMMFLPALISQDSAHFLRSIGVQTAAFAFVAFGLGKLWEEFAKVMLPWNRPEDLPEPERKAFRYARGAYGGVGIWTYAVFTIGLGGFWYNSVADNYRAVFGEYRTSVATWDAFDSWWYEMGLYINSLDNLYPGRYRVILLKEFTGNIPSLQFPLNNPKVLEKLSYGDHIPIKNAGDTETFVFIFNRSYQKEIDLLRRYYPKALFLDVNNSLGSYMFTAVHVNREDIEQSMGLSERQYVGTDLIWEGQADTIEFRDGLTHYDFPIPDRVVWDGMFYSPAIGTYEFTFESDTPFSVTLAGEEVLRVTADEITTVREEGNQFSFERILGRGQFLLNITYDHTAESQLFAARWKTGALPPQTLDDRTTFTGEVFEPEFMGVSYLQESLELRMVKRWRVESAETPLSSNPHQFVAMSLDDQGNLYCVKGTRIFVFDPDGNLLREFGERGHREGQFKHPESIVPDNRGHLYINDFWQNGLQKYTDTGEYLLRIINQHSNQISVAPDGVVFTANKWEISRIENDRVQILRKWGTGGPNGDQVVNVRFPMGVVVDPNGYLYVTDRELERTWQFIMSGDFVRTFRLEGQDYKSQMAVDAHGRFYVTTFLNPQERVQCFTDQGQAVKLDFRDETGRSFNPDLPVAIAAGVGPYVYVGSAHSSFVYKFEYDPPGPGARTGPPPPARNAPPNSEPELEAEAGE